MLYQILETIRAEGAALSLETLSRRLNLEPAVLDGMLLTLVRKGRLIALDDAQAACGACPLHQGCAGCATPKKGYMLAAPPHERGGRAEGAAPPASSLPISRP